MSLSIMSPDEPGLRLFTVADLAFFPSDVPSGTVLYELDNGKLILMPPHSDAHGAVELHIGAELKVQGERRGLGMALSGGPGVILWRNPGRVVCPDALFITNASLPLRLSPEEWLETIPELAVEVLNKFDSRPALQRKVRDYFKAGVRVVWVADPEVQTVTEHRPGQCRGC